MAVFNDLITRTGAETLIPTQYSNQIIQDAVEESAVLRMATRLPNMTSKMLSMPVLNSLPFAYFVNGDTGLKQSSKVDWANKLITAEGICHIIIFTCKLGKRYYILFYYICDCLILILM